METWFHESLWVFVVAIGGSGLVYGFLMFLARHVIPYRILSPRLVKYIMSMIRLPLGLLVVLISSRIALFALELPLSFQAVVPSVMNVLQIIAGAWLLIRCVRIIREIVINAFDIQVADNLMARKIHTQVRVVEQIVVAGIVFLALVVILMSFEKVRHLGVSMMASAGVLGIILGFAAQKSIATLFAGIQIAMTQPIRVDDVVIVEGEWGWIETITLTYVVVKIWDLRRLVVPITYFLEKPFENWTRISADILGTVFIFADYTVPIDAVRAELQRICEGSDLWDGKVCGLQVTNTTETTMELRALMGSRTSPESWDLRCLVREKLIVFLQKNYPNALPRTRLAIEVLQK